MRLQELEENQKRESKEPPKVTQTGTEIKAVGSSGEVAEVREQNAKDAFKGDSGSSDDVLTINLNSKAERKREKKQAKKERAASGETIKRKKVSFHFEKNMTRGKYHWPNSRRIPPAFQGRYQGLEAQQGEGVPGPQGRHQKDSSAGVKADGEAGRQEKALTLIHFN